MAEELDVGSVVASIEIDTAKADDGLNKIISALQKFGTALESVTKTVEKLTANANVLAPTFSNVSTAAGSAVSGLNSVAFASQNVKVSTTEATQAVSQTTQGYVEAGTAAQTSAKKQVDAATSVTTAQKKVVETSKQASGAGTALDTGATALRAVTSAAGGTVSQLGYLGTELMYLKRNMQAAATTGTMMASVLSFGIMAAVTLVSVGISALQEAEEKRQKAFEEGVENLSKYSSELQTLEHNLSVLNDNKSTTEQLTTARNNLLGTFDSMIVGYTDEGEAILATNEILEKYAETVKQKMQMARQELLDNGGYLENYEKKLNDIANAQAELERLQPYLDEYNNGNSTNNNILGLVEQQKQNIIAANENIESSYENLIEELHAYLQQQTAVKDSTSGLMLSYDDLDATTKTVANNVMLESEELLKQGVSLDEILQKYLDKINDESYVNNLFDTLTTSAQNSIVTTDQLTAAYSNLNNAIGTAASNMSSVQSDLNDAYNEMVKSGSLAQSTVDGLIGTYPELIDYIDTQTGELNINESVLRKIYELQKEAQVKELEAAKQKIIDNDSVIQSNIQRAESEIKVWEAELKKGGDTFTSARKLTEAKQSLAAYQEEYQTAVDRIDKMIETVSGRTLDLNLTPDKSATKELTEYQQALKNLDHQKKLGQVTTQQELDLLQKYRQQYEMTADEIMDWEVRVYNLRKSLSEETKKAQEELYQQSVDSIDDLGDAITEALKAQYEEQRSAEQKRIKDSISAWDAWEDKTVALIQAEIDALDELEKQQESQAAAEKYYQKSQELKLQIAYENDDNQRTQLQKELNRLSEEEQKRLQQEAKEQKKAELQTQIDNVSSIADERRAALNDELDVINDNYDELTSALSLRAQAEQAIMQQSQEDIVGLITSYAPDYKLAGETIGESLYNALKSKVDNIYSYVNDVMSSITAMQKQAEAAAIDAANKYEETYKAQQSKNAEKSKTVVINNTKNVSNGDGWINGYMASITAPEAVTLAAADTVNPRIDRVVLRVDFLLRKMLVTAITGTATATPTAPDLVRTSSYYDIGLATVAIAANATAITQVDITDTRTDSDVCGIVTGLIDQINTTGLFAQFTAAFNDWFANLHSQLDDNQAAHLQNEIDELDETVTELAETISQIGDILTTARTNLEGYLLCNGEEITELAYPQLYGLLEPASSLSPNDWVYDNSLGSVTPPTYSGSVLGSMTYAQGYYIAAKGALVEYTTDPTLGWTSYTLPFVSRNLYYGNGYWVAIGSDNIIRYTTDIFGSWQTSAQVGTSGVINLKYVNDTWLAWSSSIIYFTTDVTATTWNTISSPITA